MVADLLPEIEIQFTVIARPEVSGRHDSLVYHWRERCNAGINARNYRVGRCRRG